MKRISVDWLVFLSSSIAACGDSGGVGGAGGSEPSGGAPPATCYLAPQCVAGDEATCVCNGCNPDGCYEPDASPAIESDCTCSVCADNTSCGGCDQNGECDPFLERCDCIDCAGFPSCQ